MSAARTGIGRMVGLEQQKGPTYIQNIYIYLYDQIFNCNSYNILNTIYITYSI